MWAPVCGPSPGLAAERSTIDPRSLLAPAVHEGQTQTRAMAEEGLPPGWQSATSKNREIEYVARFPYVLERTHDVHARRVRWLEEDLEFEKSDLEVAKAELDAARQKKETNQRKCCRKMLQELEYVLKRKHDDHAHRVRMLEAELKWEKSDLEAAKAELDAAREK